VSAAVRNGRTRRERANADNLKAQRRQPCSRCGQRIDYTLPTDHPQAFNAGHIKAWRDYPELRDDPANLQPEHAHCGKSAHTSDSVALGVISRDW
jgi:hypothetical protein